MVDVWLGRFLDRLENLGLAGNTLVVLVSDHGVLLGERGWVGKRYSEMHEELTHVPLAMRHPAGKATGRTSSYFASHPRRGPDGAVGARRGRAARHERRGPVPAVRRPGAARRSASYRTAAYNTYLSASDGRWLLIAGNHREELRLYDRKNDRFERHNVAHRHPKKVHELWGKILHDAGGHLPHFPKTGGEG